MTAMVGRAEVSGDSGDVEARRLWYGAGGNGGEQQTLRARRKRATVVAAGGLGLMAVILIISPLDMKLSKPGMKSVSGREDKGAGRFVVSETQSLLSKIGARVRLQRLMDVGSVTAAAQRELASDMSALKSIHSIKSWGFPGMASKLSSDRSAGGPAGAIIESATDIYEQASKLAGDSPVLRDPTSTRATLRAADDESVQEAYHPVKVPFAKDKGWSLAKEKSDMDSFYDSLDHAAAVKEAKVRKEHAAQAAFRQTVSKAKAELKEIEKGHMGGSKAAAPSRVVTAGDSASSTLAVTDKPAVKSASTTASKPVAESAVQKVATIVAEKHLQTAKGSPSEIEGHDASEAKSKMPKLTDKKARNKIMGYFDTLVRQAKSHGDLEHPVERNPSLSADAARKGINTYFSALEVKEKPVHRPAHQADKPAEMAKNKHLTDSQARAGALSFFDSEVKKAQAQQALVAKKLGVRHKSIATVEQMQVRDSASTSASKNAKAKPNPNASVNALEWRQRWQKQGMVPQKPKTKEAAPPKEVLQGPAHHVLESPGQASTKALAAPAKPVPAAHGGDPVPESRAPVSREDADKAVKLADHVEVKAASIMKAVSTGTKPAPAVVDSAKTAVQEAHKEETAKVPALTKSEAHALAETALRKHDALVAAQQRAAQQHLLSQPEAAAAAKKASEAASAALAVLANGGSGVAGGEPGVTSGNGRPRLELQEWPSDDSTL